jgi:hypothetical protein
MRFATLISWLVTAGLGTFMLRTWVARGGLRGERAKDDGLPPQLIFGHAALAVTGLLLWVGYLVSGARPLAWAAVGALMLVVSLGLCTVTLWTPYPTPRPGERRLGATADEPVPITPDTAESAATAALTNAGTAAVDADDEQAAYQVTDEMIARLLANPSPVTSSRPIGLNLAALVPVAHGFAAITTFLLAVLTAIG